MKHEKSKNLNLGWDDLRYVLAVAQNGILMKAAEQLRVSHTTVFRRIKEIEANLETRLFDRSKSGYIATEAAQALIDLAQHFEDEIHRVALQVSGIDERPSGVVRLSTTDLLMNEIIQEFLIEFRLSFPLLQLEINTSNSVLNLNKREADICLRPGDTPPDYLVGKKICSMESTIYAPVAWNKVTMSNLTDFPWLTADDSLSHLSSSRWLQDRGLVEKSIFRSSNRLHLANAAKAGLGLAVLPCFVGDRSPTLRRVCTPIPEFQTSIWVLYHPDLRRVKRVQSLVNFLYHSLQAYRPLFEGKLSPKKRKQSDPT